MSIDVDPGYLSDDPSIFDFDATGRWPSSNSIGRSATKFARISNAWGPASSYEVELFICYKDKTRKQWVLWGSRLYEDDLGDYREAQWRIATCPTRGMDKRSAAIFLLGEVHRYLIEHTEYAHLFCPSPVGSLLSAADIAAALKTVPRQ